MTDVLLCHKPGADGEEALVRSQQQWKSHFLAILGKVTSQDRRVSRAGQMAAVFLRTDPFFILLRARAPLGHTLSDQLGCQREKGEKSRITAWCQLGSGKRAPERRARREAPAQAQPPKKEVRRASGRPPRPPRPMFRSSWLHSASTVSISASAHLWGGTESAQILGLEASGTFSGGPPREARQR